MANTKRIKERIERHVDFILNKELIDYFDYQTLVSEINRRENEEREKKYEESEKKRTEQMKSMLETICAH
jgi:hypothetical protein